MLAQSLSAGDSPRHTPQPAAPGRWTVFLRTGLAEERSGALVVTGNPSRSLAEQLERNGLR